MRSSGLISLANYSHETVKLNVNPVTAFRESVHKPVNLSGIVQSRARSGNCAFTVLRRATENLSNP